MVNSIKQIHFMILPVLLITLTGFMDASNIKDVEDVKIEAHYVSFNEFHFTPCASEIGFSESARECTVRIKTGDMDLEITLHDVSRWDCINLKAKALWARVTGKI